ncbi:MAG: glycosyltransferase, partial [Caulobacteraceae bacterium]
MKNVLKTVKSRVRKRIRAQRERDSGLTQAVRAADGARDRRDWGVAADLYRKALEIDPNRVGLRVQLGHALKEGGDFEGAELQYQCALEATPHDDDLRLQLGHFEKLRGDPDAAIAYYRQALFLDQDNGQARKELFALTGSDFFDAMRVAASLPPGRGLDGKPAPRQGSRNTSRSKARDPRRLGDAHRAAREWIAAAAAYREHLSGRPQDIVVWRQLGECLRAARDAEGAAGAYRIALANEPDDVELLLDAGRLARQRGRDDEAAGLLRRAVALSPTREVAAELLDVEPHVDLDALIAREPKTTSILYLEISDLIEVMKSQSSLSGIQRVQFGLISYILETLEPAQRARIRFVGWSRKRPWLFNETTLRRIIENYSQDWGLQFGAQKNLITRLESASTYVAPTKGDTFLSTGVIYFHPDLAAARESMRRRGVTLGAAIYDFIPLTHPEFCDPRLTQQFSPSISEALAQTDFAITISEFVAAEAKRLMAQADFPAVPIRAIPLAHSFAPQGADSQSDSWTPEIAALAGEEFVLNVSTLNAHKNQAFLLHLWRLLLERGVKVPRLVLVGRRSFGVEDLYAQLQATNYLDGRVLVLDGPTDEALSTLYRHCLFTMFPSFVEGWGLPVGESLAHGKVCICSNTSSIPEVGGDLALYIDPYNVRAAADLVAGLLTDRGRLRDMEDRISREFRPRTWGEYGGTFLSVADELADEARAARERESGPKLALAPGQMIHPAPQPTSWTYGPKLPAWSEVGETIFPRIIFGRGWSGLDARGVWMDARTAELSIPLGAEPRTLVRIGLALRRRDLHRYGLRLTIASNCGARRVIRVADKGLAWIDCQVGPAGYVDLILDCDAGAVGHLPGVSSLSWFPGEEFQKILPAGVFFAVSSVINANGEVAAATTPDAILAALKRRSMLTEGWDEPDERGVAMSGARGKIAFRVAHTAEETVRIALKMRAEASRRHRRLQISQRGQPSAETALAREGGDLIVWQDCTVGGEGRVELDVRLETDRGDASVHVARGVKLLGVAYARSNSDADRLALFEALFGAKDQAEGASQGSSVLEGQPKFTVTGHLRGSYSLASVNRRLALALEAAYPGRVRTEQVDITPTRDLADVAEGDRQGLAKLASRSLPSDGPEIVISQHWPLWEPPERGDLALAYVFWEESLAPLDMVRRINSAFDGVLAPSTSVARSLVNSGVAVPLRTIGFAPKLDDLLELGERRLNRRLFSNGPSGPFTFLHVSSAFPRKGVDALLAAWAKAFAH